MRHAAQNTLRIPNFLRRLGGCNPKLELNRQYSGKRWKPSKSTHKVYDIPPQVRRDRIATLQRVQAMLYNAYKVRPYRVELFGSTLYGVSTPNSDLDMVILDPNRPQGQKIQKVAPIYAIRNLAKNFQRAGFTRVVAIPKAKVPIDGDINANDRLGLFNSRMIKHYCDIQPLLRPMLAFIKSWASPLGLNKPGIVDGPPTFSSYAFALMTIAFLQNIRLLPNLQDFTNTPLDSDQVFVHQNKPCHIQFRRIAPGAWLPPATLTLQEALYGWFKFWGMEYQYSVSRVDIRAGYYDVPPLSTMSSTTLHPEDKLRSKGLKVRLIDPFTNANVTDHIPAKAIETFRTECLHIMNLILPRSGPDPMSMSTTTPSPSSSSPPSFPTTTIPPSYPNTVDVKLARLRRLIREPAPEVRIRSRFQKVKKYSKTSKGKKHTHPHPQSQKGAVGSLEDLRRKLEGNSPNGKPQDQPRGA
ncbi:hypothetical protein EV359DRAFT_60916 [Lentinula novae-zelandiae]|nr:hypothetical protein EV359DRAFT_60916 [Lentinula novae-zelandiae]